MTPGIWQIMIVVIVVVLFFGAGRVPRMMEDLGKGIKSFRKGMQDGDDQKSITSSETVKADSAEKTEHSDHKA